MPRPGAITQDQRDRYNRQRRKRWEERSRHDPEWKQRQLNNRSAWDKLGTISEAVAKDNA
jgi:hypothetical protein